MLLSLFLGINQKIHTNDMSWTGSEFSGSGVQRGTVTVPAGSLNCVCECVYERVAVNPCSE